MVVLALGYFWFRFAMKKAEEGLERQRRLENHLSKIKETNELLKQQNLLIQARIDQLYTGEIEVYDHEPPSRLQ